MKPEKTVIMLSIALVTALGALTAQAGGGGPSNGDQPNPRTATESWDQAAPGGSKVGSHSPEEVGCLAGTSPIAQALAQSAIGTTQWECVDHQLEGCTVVSTEFDYRDDGQGPYCHAVVTMQGIRAPKSKLRAVQSGTVPKELGTVWTAPQAALACLSKSDPMAAALENDAKAGALAECASSGLSNCSIISTSMDYGWGTHCAASAFAQGDASGVETPKKTGTPKKDASRQVNPVTLGANSNPSSSQTVGQVQAQAQIFTAESEDGSCDDYELYHTGEYGTKAELEQQAIGAAKAQCFSAGFQDCEVLYTAVKSERAESCSALTAYYMQATVAGHSTN